MEQVNASMDQATSAAPAAVAKQQSNMGMMVAVVACAVLAVGGIGYGVWATMNGNTQKEEFHTQISALKQQVNDLAGEEVYEKTDAATVDNNETIVIAEKTIDNYLAQSLINPYLKTFNYLNNMLDYEFNEDVKAEIALQNVSPNSSMVDSAVGYYELNQQYQKLFGGTLEKRDYLAGHADIIKYDGTNGSGRFNIAFYEGGGAGNSLFSVVKGAKYDGQNVVVEVYHDITPLCDDAEDGYCVDHPNNSAVVNSIEEYNMKELIEKFGDRIPVYKMTFVKDNGHYVLSAVEKES